MSAPKEETTSILILGSSYASAEELVGEYKKIYSDKSKAKEFYLVVLIELQKAITEGNIDHFKNLCNVIDCVCHLEDQATLEEYYDNLNNPLGRTNLVILASKHNRVKILEYLLGGESKVLNSLSVCIGKKTISPADEDEERHNAFYYAIRSENIELLDALIDKWPNNYFAGRSEELDEFLSKAYGELKLKNVPLSVESEMNVEKKLIDLRFFSKSSGQIQRITNDFVKIRQRVELLLEAIRLLETDYSGTEKVNDRFLFIAKSIARNMNILKGQIKSTYDKLPWEEMEFCLVIFVYSQAKTKPQALNLFYRCQLSKCKILNYLAQFANRLEKEKSNIKGDKFNCFPTKPVVKKKTKETIEVAKNREEILENNYPEFGQLIDDFQHIRDMHSLQKIGDHIKWALASDASETEGKFVITRSLQVIGEHLKYSLESPKLSRDTGNLLVSLLPKNAKTIITRLRDAISHADSLSIRMEIEKKTEARFFINVQNEIKTIGGVITDILHKNKIKTIRVLLEKIILSKNLEDAKAVLEELEELDRYESITVNFKRSEHENLEDLIKEFSDNIPNKTDYERDLFKEINSIIDSGGTQSKSIITDYLIGYTALQALSFALGNIKIDNDLISQIKRDALETFQKITPNIKLHRLIDVAKLAISIFLSAETRMEEDKFCGVKRLLTKICIISDSELDCINSISRFHEELQKDDSTLANGTKDSKCNNIQIRLQLTELLTNILDKYPLSDQLYIVYYKSDKKLQSAVEMLVLDIMSSSESYLENNQLCLDDYSPLLTGKSLRNHLAHDNAVVDVLLTDRSRSVILNAKKLTEENIAFEKNIGKLIHDDPIRSRDKYLQDLYTITNQEEMFVALREGKLESFKDCLRNGADIKARSINSWTTLHFAAMGPSLKIIKFILDQGINVNVKDDDGRTPLHIAAAYGRQNLVAYFITEAGAHVNNPNDGDKTPLHFAAQNGHQGCVEVLVNNEANTFVQDKSGFSPLQYSISNHHADIAMILLKKEISVDINETINGTTRLFKASLHGQLDLINFLLKNGADVNAGNDNSGEVPLHAAAFKGHPDAVDALIGKGANVNSRNKINHRTPLHFAALGGNIKVTNILVDREANVNAADKTGAMALHYATSKCGYPDIVTTLLKNNADPNLTNDAGMTPLHFAANYNHLEIVTILCKQPGLDVNSKCKDQSTPLHYAANGGHKEVVAFLLENGADVDVQNKNSTALYVAALKGHKDVADILIKYNAEVNVRDNAGNTPLHVATKHGHGDIVALLVKKAEVNALCNDGSSALHLAVLKGRKDIMDLLIEHEAQFDVGNCDFGALLISAISGGGKEIVECLLGNGAKFIIMKYANPLIHAIGLNNKDIVEILIARGANISEYGGEALLAAIYHGHSDIVDILLKNEVNVNKEDSQSTSPLHLAVGVGNKRVVNALIRKQVKVDAKDDNYVTPLALAAYNGNEEIVKLLVERGKAAVDDKTGMGPTPIHVAALKGHSNVIKFLLDKKVNINVNNDQNKTPLELAACHGHLQVVKLLLECEKIDMNAKGHNDFTILHYASLGNNLELIKYLVDEDCNINAEDSIGYKPVHVAAEEGYKDIVEFFVSKGISINDPVKDNSTMLHMAATNGHLEFANYLIAQRADVNPEDINGMTPISFATVCRHKDIVGVFLDNGVDINASGPFNSTILHIAASKGYLEIVHYLIARGADVSVKNSNGDTPIKLLLKNDEFNKTILEMADSADLNNLLASIEKLFNSSQFEGEEAAAMHSYFSEIEEVKNPSKDIYFAARQGDVLTVRRLLESGGDPNQKDVHGEVALHYAMLYKRMNVVDILLEYGAEVAQVINNEKSSLRAATPDSLGDLFISLMRHISQIKLNHYIKFKTSSSGATQHQVAPKMSGWDIAKSLLEQDAFPDIPEVKAQEMLKNSKDQEVNDLLNLFGNMDYRS